MINIESEANMAARARVLHATRRREVATSMMAALLQTRPETSHKQFESLATYGVMATYAVMITDILLAELDKASPTALATPAAKG